MAMLQKAKVNQLKMSYLQVHSVNVHMSKPPFLYQIAIIVISESS